MGMAVDLVYSPRARVVQQWKLVLEVGATVADAVQRSGVLAPLTAVQVEGLEWGIWGRKVSHSQVLRDGDRVELYRALLVDPKVARRERFVRQGAKTAGLFAKRRVGAKAGY
jgi:putative ubiquitin-RnfH superfamily antitoxin RatB of RatAB toxin-antitoxin module